METLKRETEVTDEQLASVEETDLPKSSSHFDNTVEIQTDIIEDKARTAMNRRQAGINDSSVKQTNQEAGSLTSAMVTGGDISPTQGNYSNLCNYNKINDLMLDFNFSLSSNNYNCVVGQRNRLLHGGGKIIIYI